MNRTKVAMLVFVGSVTLGLICWWAVSSTRPVGMLERRLRQDGVIEAFEDADEDTAKVMVVATWVDLTFPKERLGDTLATHIAAYSHLNDNPEYLIPRLLVDAAEHGTFQCFARSYVLMEALRGMGWRLRRAKFQSLEGEGHTMVDIWLPTQRRWALFGMQTLSFYTIRGELVGALQARRAFGGGEYVVGKDSLATTVFNHYAPGFLLSPTPMGTRITLESGNIVVLAKDGAGGMILAMVSPDCSLVILGEDGRLWEWPQ